MNLSSRGWAPPASGPSGGPVATPNGDSARRPATPPLHAHRHRPGARRPRAHAAGAEAVLASHAGPAQAGDRSSWLPDTVDLTVGYGLDGLELEAFGRHVTGSGDAGYRFGFGGTLEY